MRNKIWMAAIIMIALVFVGSGYTVEPTNEIFNLWQSIIDLNRDVFPDSNKVYPGDTILVPWEQDTMQVIVQSWDSTGTHNCMWNIARLLATGETDSIQFVPDTTNVNNVANTASSFPLWIIWVIVAAAVVAVLIWWLLRERSLNLNNPRHPAVVRDGLGSEPTEALRKIQTVINCSNRGIVRGIVAGRLLYNLGHGSFIADVKFYDFTPRRKRIPHGECAYRVTIAESDADDAKTHEEIWLERCGNQVLAKLPKGWDFIPEGEYTKIAAKTDTLTADINETAEETATDEVDETDNLPVVTEATDDPVREVEVAMTNGDGTVTIKAKGNSSVLPTRVERTRGKDGDEKMVISFRREPVEK